MKLAGTTALVTGASGGIGQATARALARRGVRLVLTGRDARVLEALAAEVGGRAVPADLTGRKAIAKMMKQAGPVDILVANAGVIAPARMTDHDLDEIDHYLELNLRVPLVMARLAAERMVANGRGHLVFMSSIGGKMAHPHLAVYNATKHGLRGFGHAARMDLAPYGVGVSVICPGLVRDAGMLARTSLTVPPWMTRSPLHVARAVCRAILTDAAEIDVAPLPVRVAAGLASVWPGAGARVQRFMGVEGYARAAAGRGFL
ncbi:SDR family NAD(P)-dependent oxidoreductase [Nonomuraea angiospora]|uniref:SDR family NAD(P)-dependent oxidoreductase n=1 Tax=Nonomuraea angiospora TaxID=46172 RepID=UPI0034325128